MKSMTEQDPLKKIEDDMSKLQKQLEKQRAGEAKERGNMFSWGVWSGVWFGLLDAPIIAGLTSVGIVWSAADMAAHAIRGKGIKKRISKLQEQSDKIQVARATDPRWIEANANMAEKFNETAAKIDEKLSSLKQDIDRNQGPDFTPFKK